ncbi:MAG: hypothetical protein KZQ58_08690 [gamma proteobacterium symbiont of Bathyaustriella thionipta]|nr:hypothetical protein [gamma proteobacterium symbiont of Bathyaustriella thionipta]
MRNQSLKLRSRLLMLGVLPAALMALILGWHISSSQQDMLQSAYVERSKTFPDYP